MQELQKFAVHTADTAWIARNRAVADDAGRMVITVPADSIERVRMAGRNWLRTRLADRPRDIPNPSVMCPAAWVEDPEVTARRPEALDGRALFLAMARAEGSTR